LLCWRFALISLIKSDTFILRRRAISFSPSQNAFSRDTVVLRLPKRIDIRTAVGDLMLPTQREENIIFIDGFGWKSFTFGIS